MNNNRNVVKSSAALVSSLLIAAVGLIPALSFSSIVNANGQVSTRSITTSDSTVGAVTKYKVTFTPATAGQSLVIDFCQDSAIIGASCNTTNGVTFSSPTITNGNLTGTPTIGSSTGSTIKITTTTAWSAGTAYNFTINNVKNPTGTSATVGAVGSYYGRLYTYSDATYGSTGTAYSSPTVLGSYVDYGGFALSTANNVSVTATVMETLTFCASKVAPSAGCTSTSTPALVLGSGSPVTLGTSFATDTAYTQLSTNALTGASVSLYTTSSNTCAGLSRDGGSTCGISAIGNTSTASGSFNGNFGLNVANGTGGTGTVSAAAPYNTASQYAMNNAASTTPQTIESSSTAVANVNSLLTYGANAQTTTPAGVYSTTEALIATGTF